MAVCSARLSPLFRGALLLPAWRMIILNDFDAIYAVASRGRVMDHNDRQSWRDAAKVKRSAVRRATRSPVNKFRLGWVDARCRESFPPGLSRMKLTRERSNRAGGSCRMLSSGSVQDTPRSAPSRPPSSPFFRFLPMSRCRCVITFFPLSLEQLRAGVGSKSKYFAHGNFAQLSRTFDLSRVSRDCGWSMRAGWENIRKFFRVSFFGTLNVCDRTNFACNNQIFANL